MTSIYQIRDNLKSTIAGKQEMLSQYRDAQKTTMGAEDAAIFAVMQFLKANLEELNKILADVEKCCEKTAAESWIGVDRQGGI